MEKGSKEDENEWVKEIMSLYCQGIQERVIFTGANSTVSNTVKLSNKIQWDSVLWI
jgi:hypothetical protein